MANRNFKEPKLVREIVGGDTYDYYPLGKYVVSCPEVCRGRPTFKYTRVEVQGILQLLAAGWSIEKIVADYNRPEISKDAIKEAAELAAHALLKSAPGLKAKPKAIVQNEEILSLAWPVKRLRGKVK